MSSSEDCTQLSGTMHEDKINFFTHVPDVRRIPSSGMKEPPGKDEVTKRLESKEGRTSSQEKMQDIPKLRETVFRSRFEKCFWDVDMCLESRSRLYGRVLFVLVEINTPTRRF